MATDDGTPPGHVPDEVPGDTLLPGIEGTENDTLITPRPPAPHPDDVLPADGGRRARRLAAEDGDGAARATPSPLGRWVIPAALVLIAAVGVVAAWNHYQSGEPTASGGPAAPTGAATQPGDGASPVPSTSSPSPSPSTVPSTSSTPSPSVTTSHSASPSRTPSPSPSTSTSTPARPVDRKVPIVVLNGTNRPGLAAKVAAQLRAKGWNVTGVGNWGGGKVATTRLYLNGHLDAQATIAKDWPHFAEPILQPLPGMPRLRMVVVLGDDYRG